MSEWSVHVDIEILDLIDEEVVDNIMAALEDYAGSVSAGQVDEETSKVGVTVTVEADMIVEAINAALDLIDGVLDDTGSGPWRQVRVEASDADHLAQALGESNFPDIVGANEVAKMLGVSRQRVHQLRTTKTFPEPMVELAATPVWFRAAIERYRELPRKGGRPRRASVRQGVHDSTLDAALLGPDERAIGWQLTCRASSASTRRPWQPCSAGCAKSARPSPMFASIYLDQLHWIGLAKARLGREDGKPYLRTLSLLIETSVAGKVIVPLSATHYMEMAKITDVRKRADVANVMAELSHFVTLASSVPRLRCEVAAALHQRLGRPMFPEKLRPFGVGIAFAFGIGDGPVGRIVERTGVIPSGQKPGYVAELEHRLNQVAEYILFAGQVRRTLRRCPSTIR